MLIEDVLIPGLRVVFCGTALGRTSHERKAYYAHPRNIFWKTLHDVGLTERQLKPDEYRSAIEHGIGLTDLCKVEFGNDNQLSPRALDRDALGTKIEAYRPAILAFTSLKGGRAFCGHKAVLGWQDSTISGTCIYILPSTSPSARWNWDRNKAHWDTLAAAAKAPMSAAGPRGQ